MAGLIELAAPLGLVFLLGAASLVSAWALLRGFKGGTATLLGAAGAGLIMLAVYFLIRPSVPPGHFTGVLHQKTESTAQQMAGAGYSAQQVKDFQEASQKLFIDILPAWMAFFCLMTGLVSYYLVSLVLAGMTHKVRKPSAFRELLFPEPLVFGLILGFLLVISRPVLPEAYHGTMGYWGNNLLAFFTMLYFIGGLSIFSHFLHRWKVGPVLKVLCYMLMLFSPPLIASALGILDIWFDFRKIKGLPHPPATA